MRSPQEARTDALAAISLADTEVRESRSSMVGAASGGIAWSVGPSGRVILDLMRASAVASCGSLLVVRMRIDEQNRIDLVYYGHATGEPFTVDDFDALNRCAQAVKGAAC